MRQPLQRRRALCVFGTRPDAIKMAPVVKELHAHSERWQVRIVVTGQHREQLDQVLRVFDITPDVDLAIMQHGQSLAAITSRSLIGVDAELREHPADVVIAQGDTTTTFAAALGAFYHKAAFAHVEAGLRTGDPYDPFPEEMNRRLVSDIASYHFAPTSEARAHLEREGVPADRIWITGNTGIDALLMVAASPQALDDDVARIIEAPGPLVLITAHRRENWGKPLVSICKGVRRLAADFPGARFVYAWHRNPELRATVAGELGDVTNIRLLDPPDYAPFVKLMQRATLILTDSGGIQEEAPSLGVPVLVLRRTTERPEGVQAGVARLVGADTDRIVAEATHLLTDEGARHAMVAAGNPYGDGCAAQRIRATLEEGPAS